MEKQQYILKLPLKQIALRKVAICLWKGKDIVNLMNQNQTGNMPFFIENVKEKVSSLVLPTEIKEELTYLIEPICYEIENWKIHPQSLLPVEEVLDLLCWTSVGTVDYRETAAALLKLEQVNVMSRYQLACMYCLDNDIPLIWESLSEDTKKCFYDKKSFTLAELVIIWTHILKGDEAKLNYRINRFCAEHTLYQYAFVYSAQSANKAATQYFFNKLTLEEKKRTLQEATQHLLANGSNARTCSCDVLCFLLSQMEKEEQMRIFEKDTPACLRLLLTWNWQSLFMKVAGLSWAFLSKVKYYQLIYSMAWGLYVTNKEELFAEFFLHAPCDFREYMMDLLRKSEFWLIYFFMANNTLPIKLVIRNADNSDKMRFIMCEKGLQICRWLAYHKKWSLLKLFIAECVCALTEEAKTKLKDDIRSFTNPFKEQQREIFHLIDTGNEEDSSKTLEVVEND